MLITGGHIYEMTTATAAASAHIAVCVLQHISEIGQLEGLPAHEQRRCIGDRFVWRRHDSAKASRERRFTVEYVATAVV